MSTSPDWEVIAASPKFKRLVARKRIVLSGLMLFSVCFYFLLPLGAAYYQEVFKRQVWGPLNIGLVFALSEFVVAWAVALIYLRIASKTFDVLAAEIVADAEASK